MISGVIRTRRAKVSGSTRLSASRGPGGPLRAAASPPQPFLGEVPEGAPFSISGPPQRGPSRPSPEDLRGEDAMHGVTHRLHPFPDRHADQLEAVVEAVRAFHHRRSDASGRVLEPAADRPGPFGDLAGPFRGR